MTQDHIPQQEPRDEDANVVAENQQQQQVAQEDAMAENKGTVTVTLLGNLVPTDLLIYLYS